MSLSAPYMRRGNAVATNGVKAGVTGGNPTECQGCVSAGQRDEATQDVTPRHRPRQVRYLSCPPGPLAAQRRVRGDRRPRRTRHHLDRPDRTGHEHEPATPVVARAIRARPFAPPAGVPHLDVDPVATSDHTHVDRRVAGAVLDRVRDELVDGQNERPRRSSRHAELAEPPLEVSPEGAERPDIGRTPALEARGAVQVELGGAHGRRLRSVRAVTLAPCHRGSIGEDRHRGRPTEGGRGGDA
jgi:hypothetical protein